MIQERRKITVLTPKRTGLKPDFSLYRRLSTALYDEVIPWELVITGDFLHVGADSAAGQASVVAGAHENFADLIVVMDGARRHPPESVPDLIAPLLSGEADIAVGRARGRTGHGLSGRLGYGISLASRSLARVLVPSARSVRDPLSGFFAFRREVIDGADLAPDCYRVLLEVLARGHWQLAADVPYVLAAHGCSVDRSASSIAAQSRSAPSEAHKTKWAIGRPHVADRTTVGLRRVGAFMTIGTRTTRPSPAYNRVRNSLVFGKFASLGIQTMAPMPVTPAGPGRLSKFTDSAFPVRADLPGVAKPVSSPTQALRVLLLTSEAPPVVSGISRTAAMLSEGLRSAGHEVDVVSRVDFPYFVRNEYRFSAFIFSWPRIRRQLSNYDVVNVFGPVPTISEVFLGLSATIRAADRPAIVYTHHSDLAIPGMVRWCRLYNRVSDRLAHNADVVVVTSEDYLQKLSKRGETQLEVVPWGVDTRHKVRRRAPSEQGPLRVLFVGQFRPYKGLQTLLEAVGGYPWIELSLIGDGPLRVNLEKHAANLGLANVTFLGRVTDDQLWRAYSEHDVVVLPSTTSAEAFGLVLTEGMAAGCVPVASDLDGVREVAAPTGLLARPGDVTHLREQLRRLADDRELLERLRLASLDRSQDFTFSKMVNRYEAIIEDAVASASARRDRAIVPRRWSTPQDLLEAACQAVGTTRASLVLFVRSTTSGRMAAAEHLRPTTLWTSAGDRSKIDSSPISEFVARTSTLR